MCIYVSSGAYALRYAIGRLVEVLHKDNVLSN
jgi:hypothetical protein